MFGGRVFGRRYNYCPVSVCFPLWIIAAQQLSHLTSLNVVIKVRTY